MMEYKEDDYLMLSGIQHFKFCRRQWALIHIEQQWEDNIHTVIGELIHEKVHDPYMKEKRKDVIISRGLPVFSRTMGLSGNCDVVEFHRQEEGVRLFGHRDFYKVYPIEYKKGRPKESDEDIMQLAAQAICLEEMFSTEITDGAIFYSSIRQRETVEITENLKQQVRETVAEMHQYYDRRYTPRVKSSKRCISCSLRDICMPGLGKAVSVERYMRQILEDTE